MFRTITALVAITAAPASADTAGTPVATPTTQPSQASFCCNLASALH
jgi:hypothetical protein